MTAGFRNLIEYFVEYIKVIIVHRNVHFSFLKIINAVPLNTIK